MRKVKIITDSSSDLDEETLKKYDISVIPLYIIFGDKEYKDNVDITVSELYEKVKENKALPKTSAVSVNDFINHFSKWLDEGYDIVFSGISKQMSSTYNNANLAVMELEAEDRISIVDSMNLSSGIGLLLIKASKMALNGLSHIEIKNELEKITPKVRSQFTIETFEYLHKGGRCSSMASIFGTLLKIKPIIAVRDGKMSVCKKPHGKMKKALDTLLDMIEHDKDQLDNDVVTITHSQAFEYASYLKEELKKRIDIDLILETQAGCVISSHCGKGTIGILYILK